MLCMYYVGSLVVVVGLQIVTLCSCLRTCRWGDRSDRVTPAWFNYSGYDHSDAEIEGGRAKIAMLLLLITLVITRTGDTQGTE